MLIEFSVENVLSYKHRTTFSMVASSEQTLQENVVDDPAGFSLNLLKSAFILGPNNSGKSNLIVALSLLKQIITSSSQKAVSVQPFMLNRHMAEKESKFEITLLCPSVRWVYGISIKRQCIQSEWLYSYPSGQRRLYFERYYDSESQSSRFKYGKHWKKIKGLDKDIPSYTSFLALAAQNGHDTAMAILSYFQDNMIFMNHANQLDLTPLNGHTEFKDEILKWINLGDFNIEDIYLEPLDNQLKLRYKQGSGENGFAEPIVFNMEELSSGFQHWIQWILRIVSRRGKHSVFIMDDFDHHWHPSLTRAFLNYWHRQTMGDAHHQLVVSSHNINLLDPSLLRRDQVWFTQRMVEDGSSELYSLWGYKKHSMGDQTIRMNYLNGKYGAIPLIESGYR